MNSQEYSNPGGDTASFHAGNSNSVVGTTFGGRSADSSGFGRGGPRDSRSRLLFLGLLFLALVWAVVALVYVARFPGRMSTLTEFYLLSTDKTAIGYPSELKVGERGVVLVGIRNLEGEPRDYWLRVTIAGEESQTLGPISMPPEEGREIEVAFIPAWAGEQQKVEFLLYKEVPQEAMKPYHSLFLLVNVR